MGKGWKRQKKSESAEFAQERFNAYNADGQMSKNAKKKARGKVFDYERGSEEVQEGLDASRRTEWE